jgi:hypothetical protein
MQYSTFNTARTAAALSRGVVLYAHNDAATTSGLSARTIAALRHMHETHGNEPFNPLTYDRKIVERLTAYGCLRYVSGGESTNRDDIKRFTTDTAPCAYRVTRGVV